MITNTSGLGIEEMGGIVLVGVSNKGWSISEKYVSKAFY